LGGNVSDAVAVVATGGERRRYVGLGAEVGDELFRLVHDAAFKALAISTWTGSFGQALG
jgi:adenosylcobinamide amidohydrolase